MSVPLFVPFNHLPSSVNVQTGSYSIPAGYYARAVVNITGSGNFSVNGSNVLIGSQNTVLASDNLRTSNYSTGPTNDYIGSLTVTTTSDASWKNPIGSAFNESTDEKVITQDYWLPSGTTINGSNYRALIELYLIPS